MLGEFLVVAALLALGWFVAFTQRWRRTKRAGAAPRRFTRRGVRHAYDYVVVGSGSAGAVAAARLVELLPKATVLLIEAGGEHHRRTDLHHQPSRWFGLAYDASVDWLHATLPLPALAGRALHYARGKTTGGSSAVNACMWVRGNARDYDGWAAAGADGWSWRDCLPALKALEAYAGGGDDALRGRDGPVHVRKVPLREPLPALLDAAVKSGLCARRDDYNDGVQDGISATQQNVSPDGARNDAFSAFVEPLLAAQADECAEPDADGDAAAAAAAAAAPAAAVPAAAAPAHANRASDRLHVLSEALCERIVFDCGPRNANDDADEDEADEPTRRPRATGVIVSCDGEGAFLISARREVIVSCGAVQTPQLLMVSGIGPRDQLDAQNITPVHINDEVGRHLEDHVCVNLPAQLKQPLPSLDAEGYSTHGSTLNFTGFVKSDVSRTDEPERGADLQFVGLASHGFEAGVLSRGLITSLLCRYAPVETLIGKLHFATVDLFSNVFDVTRFTKYMTARHTAIAVVLNHPRSRGRITLASPSMHTHPVIDLRLLENKRDVDAMLEGMRRVLDIYEQPSLKAYIKSTGKLTRNVDEQRKLLAMTGHHAFHAACTARIGAVLSPQLKVLGVDGLRVADASAMPRVISGNTNVPSMLIGYRCAEFIAAERNGAES